MEALSKPQELVNKAKKTGMKALALTDSGVMYGAIEFYQACKKADIKPIIGMELSIASLGRFNKTQENRRFNVILLAKNDIGYKNLLKIATTANLEGFYYFPRTDFEILSQYADGLICIGSWRFGEIASKLLEEKENEALQAVEKYIGIFGKDNFFLEIQCHAEDLFSQDLNEKLIPFALANNLSLVATNTSLYLNKEDKEAFEAFRCIKKGETVNDAGRKKLEADLSLKSPDEMKELFAFLPQAIDMTRKIADMIDLNIEFGQNLLPKFETPNHQSPEDYLSQLCYEGLQNKYDKANFEKATKQLEYELTIINQMGFASYFLIVWDFIKYAKDKGIMVGPGRGSAAGSIISYCLDITTIDPLKYNLIFERFLNPQRVSMPDIDIDFSDYRRDEVLQYVIQKYGEDRVAQIITFGTMAAKAAIRDAGRVLGYSYSDVDKIAKMVPPPILGKYKHLSVYLEESVELKKIYENDASARAILNIATRFEGTVRNVGTHACAVVISPDKLTNHVPIQKSVSDKGGIVTQFSMKPIDELGLLKMDFLGLSNLSVIEETINIIKKTHDIDVDIDKIELDDKKAFELFQKGHTTGVFQFESAGMKRYLKDLKPTELEDLIAMNSLYRPGPMQFIPDYIKGKHGQKQVKYIHESLKDILESTYGIAVYQEQILQIAQNFAGFSLGEADLLRRAIGKKIASELAAQRQEFIDGAKLQGHSEKLAVKMFDDIIEPFAGYGFNKAHAACYSMIAYQTAYLKAHFPAEFMAALLTSDSANTDRIAIEISECDEMGIKVLPPSINESRENFTVSGKNTIRFGLCAIKGLGNNSVKEIIKIRTESGYFINLENFAKKVPSNFLNKKTMEALIYSGAMEIFGDQNALASSIEKIATFSKTEQKSASSGQVDLFSLMDEVQNNYGLELNSAPLTSEFDKLRREKLYLGVYVTNHPLKGLRKYFKQKAKLIGELTKQDIGKTIKLGGLVVSKKKVLTKSNAMMLNVLIEDPTGRIDVVVFPKNYLQIADAFKEDEVVLLEGRLDMRADKPQYICSGAKTISIKSMIENAKKTSLYSQDEKIEFKGALQFDAEISDDIVFDDKDDTTDETSNCVVSETYYIEVPDASDLKKLKDLKELLLQNKSDDGRKIVLKFNDKQFVVPVPINITDVLKDKIFTILNG